MKSALTIVSVILLVFIGHSYHEKSEEITAYQRKEANDEAREHHWDSLRLLYPSVGYAGLLKAEAEMKAAYTSWCTKDGDNTAYYVSTRPPVLYIALQKGDLVWDKPELIIQLDSADIAYFHKKAIERVAQERKSALDKVNKSYDLLVK